jgi:endonuclease YncB( thermonuclease family)
MKQIALFVFLFIFLGVSPTFAFSGKLVKVLDGDTVEVLHNGRAERIRLNGIDTPEKGQPFGNKAKQFVLDVAAGKTVKVHGTDQDRYGRTIGEIILPGDQSLNRLLVKEGYAWWYRQYSNDRSLGQLEKLAQAEGKGLWADADPVPPWDWRRGKRNIQVQPGQSSQSFECGKKKYCTEMTSCEEALFHLEECGLSRLDGDSDGVPCEALCG